MMDCHASDIFCCTADQIWEKNLNWVTLICSVKIAFLSQNSLSEPREQHVQWHIWDGLMILASPTETINCLLICTITITTIGFWCFLTCQCRPMVWSCTVAPLWQRKAKRRKSISTLSLLSQSTPPCTSATTSFTPRWDLLLVFCVCIWYFSCREDSWNMNFSVYISLTFCDILIIHSSPTPNTGIDSLALWWQ